MKKVTQEQIDHARKQMDHTAVDVPKPKNWKMKIKSLIWNCYK